MPYKDKDKQSKYFRDLHLRKCYGINLEEYSELFNKQGGKCAICGKHQIDLTQPLFVDHDHKTGKVRGLLCITCNTALGTFGDSVEGLQKVIDYLVL